MTSDNSVKRSRRLLGIYWLYKVLNGGSIAKTTLNTLKIEANAARKQHADEQPLKERGRSAKARAGSGKREQGDSEKTGKIRGAGGIRLIKAVLKLAHII